MNLIKSKRRVADHGEVFTPRWLVEKMLDLVKGETERIDSRFLEPACGNGNFLVRILQRKLAAVELKYGRFDDLTQSAAYSAGPLFGRHGKHELFTPTKPTYPPMTVSELAAVPGTTETSLSNRRAAP